MNKIFIITLVVGILVGVGGTLLYYNSFLENANQTDLFNNEIEIIENENQDELNNSVEIESEEINDNTKENNMISDEFANSNEEQRDIEDFDLVFLKQENAKKNIIYSPLSIKYALRMLLEGSKGSTREQILKVVGNDELTKYSNNKNMSLANGLFVKNSFKDGVKQSYIDSLKQKFNADVQFDTFEKADKINDWIKEKTFGIIPTVYSDEDVDYLTFALVNALAIDMEWNEKFLFCGSKVYYSHEIIDNIYTDMDLRENLFNGTKDNQIVSGMHIEASVNNYDIVKELGEDNMKEIVKTAFENAKKEEEYEYLQNIDFEDFWKDYIKEIRSNYHRYGYTTEFELYTDNDVKVFAKDLKEYDGTTLQYIGIMPNKTNLEDFVKGTSMNTINGYINNLKPIESGSFKEGVITHIEGFIPKFKYDYNMGNLKEILMNLGIVDVFNQNADLSNMSSLEDIFVSDAKHVADIEFTQDGIKAAAVTTFGGGGAGDPFDYLFDVPTEEIDLTFDKPYMYLIRDKKTNDIWFVGTVYEPLDASLETTRSIG